MEVEEIILQHNDVQLVAGVAMADAKWGEVPVAFVQLRPGSDLSEETLIGFCRENMSRFKAPKKFLLREQLKTNQSA